MAKNAHNEKTGSSIERSDARIVETQEVFTPMDLCREMIAEIPDSKIMDPNSTYIDPYAGSGNFLVALLERLEEYHDRQHIVDNMLYAVELMPDNHTEMCERLGVTTDHPHYVCTDSFKYNFSFGEPVGLELFMQTD